MHEPHNGNTKLIKVFIVEMQPAGDAAAATTAANMSSDVATGANREPLGRNRGFGGATSTTSDPVEEAEVLVKEEEESQSRGEEAGGKKRKREGPEDEAEVMKEEIHRLKARQEEMERGMARMREGQRLRAREAELQRSNASMRAEIEAKSRPAPPRPILRPSYPARPELFTIRPEDRVWGPCPRCGADNNVVRRVRGDRWLALNPGLCPLCRVLRARLDGKVVRPLARKVNKEDEQ